MESVAGKLLVSAPHLLDPNFYRTVVFIAEHGDDGALGVVLNRATDEPITDHLPEWAAAASEPATVFVGGPVSNELAVGVAEGPRTPPEDWAPVLGAIGLIDLSAGPDATGGVNRLRVFSGYTGWITGQLEAELAIGSWFVLDARPDDVFTSEPAPMWTRVLRRQTGRLAIYATYPEDLSNN